MIFTQAMILGIEGVPLWLNPGEYLRFPDENELYVPVFVTRRTLVDAVYICRLLDVENKCVSNPLFFAHEVNTIRPSEILSIEETQKIFSTEDICKIRQSIMLYDSFGEVESNLN